MYYRTHHIYVLHLFTICFDYCLLHKLFTCLPHDVDGPAAEVVVEAEVLVAADVQKLLVGNDQLVRRKKIEE